MDNGQCTPTNTLENNITAAQTNFDVINEDISHHHQFPRYAKTSIVHFNVLALDYCPALGSLAPWHGLLQTSFSV